jgi:hypothetical protein
MGKILLRRTSQYENKARKFKVYLNDQHVNDIRDGEEIEIPSEEGQQDIQIKVDWAKSVKYKVNVNKDEEIYLLCGSPLKGAKLFIPFIPIIASFVPKWYFFIKENKTGL